MLLAGQSSLKSGGKGTEAGQHGTAAAVGPPQSTELGPHGAVVAGKEG